MASHEPEDPATRRVSVEEVEANLRRPIGIDPDRHNAHRTLGIALKGLGQLALAAQCYRRAASIRPADTRAQRCLEVLLARHPEVEEELTGAADASRPRPGWGGSPRASRDEAADA